MAWKGSAEALMLTALTEAKSLFFKNICVAAVNNFAPAFFENINDCDKVAHLFEGNSCTKYIDRDLFEGLKQLSNPQVLIVCETVFSLSLKNFSEPENLRAFLEHFNISMKSDRPFHFGFTLQGVRNKRYEEAVFPDKAIKSALFNWRNQPFRCDVSFLKRILATQMSRRLCEETVEVLSKYGLLDLEDTGTSKLITSPNIIEPIVEKYLQMILEYGAMAKCIKS